jgi:hypothetical protein
MSGLFFLLNYLPHPDFRGFPNPFGAGNARRCLIESHSDAAILAQRNRVRITLKITEFTSGESHPGRAV